MRKLIIPVTFIAVLTALATSACAVQYTSAGLRDPFMVAPKFKALFKSAQRPSVTPGIYTVQGIVFKGPRPAAIINEKVVVVGDMVDGARVVEVTKEGVRLSVDGQEFLIKITEK